MFTVIKNGSEILGSHETVGEAIQEMKQYFPNREFHVAENKYASIGVNGIQLSIRETKN